jgi:hypothetical protein
MPPDYSTRRVGILKRNLGIENKQPETVKLEDDASGCAACPRDTVPLG